MTQTVGQMRDEARKVNALERIADALERLADGIVGKEDAAK